MVDFVAFSAADGKGKRCVLLVHLAHGDGQDLVAHAGDSGELDHALLTVRIGDVLDIAHQSDDIVDFFQDDGAGFGRLYTAAVVPGGASSPSSFSSLVMAELKAGWEMKFCSAAMEMELYLTASEKKMSCSSFIKTPDLSLRDVWRINCRTYYSTSQAIPKVFHISHILICLLTDK